MFRALDGRQGKAKDGKAVFLPRRTQRTAKKSEKHLITSLFKLNSLLPLFVLSLLFAFFAFFAVKFFVLSPDFVGSYGFYI